MQTSSAHSGTGQFQPLPRISGGEIAAPEREAAALKRSVLIHTAALRLPKYTIVILFLFETDTPETADFDLPAVAI
jgi:hypothetical protein